MAGVIVLAGLASTVFTVGLSALALYLRVRHEVPAVYNARHRAPTSQASA